MRTASDWCRCSWLEGGAEVAGVLARLEDLGAFLVEDAVAYKVVDPVACLEGGVELDKGIGPEQAIVDAPPDLAFDTRVLNSYEAAHVGAVIPDEAVA
ncbi:MAG: hypothetical protein M3518_00210 [Actinomycetota bacterium]|nr:hypothetical protein [Actinomycetota bacterium]